jgi:hypothetical protein
VKEKDTHTACKFTTTPFFLKKGKPVAWYSTKKICRSFLEFINSFRTST